MIELSIIIVNYNVRYYLEQCLLSVEKSCKNLTSEIIVVDNNSSDASCTMIETLFPNVNLICNKNNLGFGKANNLGVSKAKGEYVLILNPDTILAEDTLKKTINFAKSKNNFGVLGVKMIDGKGEFLPESKRNIPTVKIASKKLIGNSKDYYANHIDENCNGKVEVLTGAFMLLKRSVFNAVKGFDEDYFMYGEDIDLCYKILNKGFQNYYFGKNTIIHFKGESTVKNKNYLRNFYGAMQIFYKKHFMKNSLDKFLQKILVNILIVFHSLKKDSVKSSNKPIKRVLVIGDLSKSYRDYLRKLKFEKLKINNHLEGNISSFDTVFIDENVVCFNKIIDLFQDDRLKNKSKRIISEQYKYYLGSDSSRDKGEVIIL